MALTRGIPEVPMLPGLDPQHRRFLQDLRQVVLQLREAQSPPSVPTNLKVTAQAFSNLIQFTRSTNADFHEVLWSTTPSLTNAVVINVGTSPQWVDQVGQVSIKRFYWVRARKNTGARSEELGPIAGTTLASNVAVTPPPPPPQSQLQRVNQRTGRIEQL